MSTPDLAHLRAVVDELAHALQGAVGRMASLTQLATEVTQEASGLREAMTRCVVALQTLQPRRDQ